MMMPRLAESGGRTPLGATVQADGVRFAVWAPKARTVEVEVDIGGAIDHRPLTEDAEGLHSGFVPGLAVGARYRYRLDRGAAYPDPASRFQPEGVHGPSEVIDPTRFPWTDDAWPGRPLEELIIYEAHVGTATPEGTFSALCNRLPDLAALGITALELMPVADFAGRWNWGYDGVDWWAPSRAYGRPDDLRRLVDRAHQHDIAVILDVVYNHFGPDGAYWRAFSDDYFTSRHKTPWGDGINVDGRHSDWVRETIVQNAEHWVREFHVDGLRLDATHAIVDDGPVHILAELSQRVRAAAAPRQVVLFAEHERDDGLVLRPVSEGGYGIDAIWADDFHHAMRVFLTGEQEGYYSAYEGTTSEIARTVERGFLGGERESAGTATDLTGARDVFCLQNHDQVGNRAFGDRLHQQIDRDRYAVAAAILLFAPQTPLLFMGQEFAASTPFAYFTDFDDELGARVTEGRRAEFAEFRAFQDATLRASIPDPQDAQTFLGSRLDPLDLEIASHIATRELYQALIALRREDPVLSDPDRASTRAHAPGAQMLTIHRWRDAQHRLLIANFGASTALPLRGLTGSRELAEREWRLLFTTADERFGGSGRAAAMTGNAARPEIKLPARTAVILDAQAPR